MKLPFFLLFGALLANVANVADAAEPAPAAAPQPDAMLATLPPDAPARRSKGMMVTGIVLTSVGSLALLGGIGVTALDASHGSDTSGLLTVVVGVPMMVGSLLFAGAGIPLWVVGARAPAGPAPKVSVGAGSATLRWTF